MSVLGTSAYGHCVAMCSNVIDRSAACLEPLRTHSEALASFLGEEEVAARVQILIEPDTSNFMDLSIHARVLDKIRLPV